MEGAVGGGPVQGRSDPRKGVIAKKGEGAVRFQDAVRLGQPAFRLAPDGGPVFRNGEIEGGIGQPGGFRIAFDECDLGSVLVSKLFRGRELVGRDVDGGDLLHRVWPSSRRRSRCRSQARRRSSRSYRRGKSGASSSGMFQMPQTGVSRAQSICPRSTQLSASAFQKSRLAVT